ncbi:hypothetical protein D3C74_471040 [compost metagenome]
MVLCDIDNLLDKLRDTHGCNDFLVHFSIYDVKGNISCFIHRQFNIELLFDLFQRSQTNSEFFFVQLLDFPQ